MVFQLWTKCTGWILEIKLLLEDFLNHFSLRKWSFISSLLMHWFPNVINCLLLFRLLFFRHDLLLFQLGKISLSFNFTYLCLSIWNYVPQLTLAVLKWCLSVGIVIYHWRVPSGFVGRAGSDVITIHAFLLVCTGCNHLAVRYGRFRAWARYEVWLPLA